MNRRIRDPYVWWCERCTGGAKSPSAAYSIMCWVYAIFMFQTIIEALIFVLQRRVLDQRSGKGRKALAAKLACGWTCGVCGMCLTAKDWQLGLSLCNFCAFNGYRSWSCHIYFQINPYYCLLTCNSMFA